MGNRARQFGVTIILAAGIASGANAVSAAPVTGALAIKNATPSNIETVQWGWPVAAGVAVGAVIGAYPYNYGYYDYPYRYRYYYEYPYRYGYYGSPYSGTCGNYYGGYPHPDSNYGYSCR